MVDFSQFRNTEDVPNWTARSQGVRAPDWGGIISDLGKSVVGGIEAVTKAEINTAEQQARSVVDETFTEYFPTEVAPSQKELPDGLKNSLSRIDTLGNAAKKAGLSKAAYFNAQIVSRLKDVRAQYGGLYDDEIYAAVTRYIGRNPRGELYDVLKEQEASQRRMMEAEYKSNLAAFSTDSAKVLYPNATAAELANAPNNRELLTKIREREALVARVDEAKKLDYLDERSLEAEAAVVVRDVLTKAYDIVDFSKEYSPQEFDQVVTQLAPLKTQLTKQLQQLERNYAGKLDGEKARAIINRNIQYLDQLYNTIASGDLNAAQVLVAANSYGESSVVANLRRNNPEAFNSITLFNKVPPAVSQIMLADLANTPKGEEFKQKIGELLLTSSMYSNSGNPMVSLYTTLTDPEVSEADKRKLLNGFINNVSMGVETAPEESKQMTAILSQPDKLADISNMFTSGHAKFFTKLTSNQFISQHEPDNPDDYWGNVIKAMTKTTKLMDDIVRMNDAARSAGSLSFNTDTGTLVYNRDPNKVRGGVYAGSPFAPESPETAGESVAKQLMGQLNPILNNYYTMLKETNPEQADQTMEAVLNTLRIDADPSQLRGEQVSSAQPDIQITPTSGITTMAEFLGRNQAVEEQYSDARNLDIAAKTLVGEARGETSEGRQAIAEVLRNRSLASGRTIAEEAQLRKGDSKYGQFSTWNEGDPNLAFIQDLDETSPLYVQASQDFLSSANSDITNGATHYYNPKKANPEWARDGNFIETARIGNHVFGYLKKGDPYLKGLSKYRNRAEFD